MGQIKNIKLHIVTDIKSNNKTSNVQRPTINMSEAGTKRVNDGDNSWEGGKKMRGDSITLRFLLNAKHAGGIIGKGGETIKRLRSEFSANVTVPDTNTNERVLTIIATPDNSLKVLRECLPLVHEAPYPVPGANKSEDGSQVEIDFLVHQSQVGGISGKGGHKIKEIREETNAKVKVYAECLPDCTERVVAIAGSEDQLINSIELMLKGIDENPIKGQATAYDPSYEHHGGFNNNYNNNFNNNNNFNGPPRGGGMRGGRGGPRGGRGGNRGGGGGGGNYGSQGGYGGGGMGQQQGYGNNYGGDGYSNNNWNQGGQGDYGYGNNGGGNYGGGNNGGGNYGGPPPSQGGGNQQGGGGGGGQSTQVTVPNDMAGAIIGKGGERIRQIRQKSQADIKFSDSEAGKADRLITISGTHDQIQYAQYLMQQCVRENHGGQM